MSPEDRDRGRRDGTGSDPRGAAEEESGHITVVWLVEDNDVLRESLADVIERADTLSCPDAFPTCEEAIEALEAGGAPDLVLMDIGLPGMDGIEGTRRIHAMSPATQIIMLTIHEESDRVFEAICAGASGYLLKPNSIDSIVESIAEVRTGGAPINARIARKVLDMFTHLAVPKKADYGLTVREVEVLNLLVDGLTLKKIAKQLFLSEHTVNTHVRNIYEKLHVHSRSSAVAKALKEGLI